MKVLLVLGVGLTAACSGIVGGASPGDAGGDDLPDGGPAATALITGTVWAPGNAPGMVSAGQEIPVSGATISLGREKPEPMAQHVECTPCTAPPPGSATSDARGGFELHAAPGTYWLVIQKAQFRIEQEIEVAGGARSLMAEATTLPSIHDPEHGKWLPHIALATSDYDAMESVLGKMGIGRVGADGAFVSGSAVGAFDVYANSGSLIGPDEGSLTALVSDLDRMKSYHIIFIPCSGDDNIGALQQPQVLHNLRDYVAAGGRLYVTDWSGEWVDNVFPGEIEFGGVVDTPASAYDRGTDTWTPAAFGTADGAPAYNSPDAEAVDPDLAAWLDDQTAPDDAPIDAQSFAVEGSWNRIEGLHAVDKGDGDGADPVMDTPRMYVQGSALVIGQKQPLTVTFEPAGCGRVLYSTYHTTDSIHVGLVPQERVLLYLLLEIGACQG